MEVIEGVGLECLQNVISKDRYGCIAYDFDIVYLKERNLTDIESRQLVTAIRGRTYNVFLGLGLEAYSMYRPNFGKVLGYAAPFNLGKIWDKLDMYYNIRMVKMQWWKDTNQTEKLTAKDEGDSSDDELTMRHIMGIFYIFFGCSALSGIVFIIEVITGCIKRLKCFCLTFMK